MRRSRMRLIGRISLWMAAVLLISVLAQTRSVALTPSTTLVEDDGASIWQYTGTPCSGVSCPGWQMLDNSVKTLKLAGGGGRLYQLQNDGSIWLYTGTPCSLGSCPGWQRLDNDSNTVDMAADGTNLYQLHNNGSIW